MQYTIETCHNGAMILLKKGDYSLFLQDQDAEQFLAELTDFERMNPSQLHDLGYQDALTAAIHSREYDSLFVK
jgi:hypothetical protein